MRAPFTKKEKEPTAEEVINEKIDRHANAAETPEEIEKVQRMIKNQEEIKNERKPKIFGLDPNIIFTGAVSLVQIGAIIKAEDLKVLTSKAMGFVHKGRLR